MINEIKKCFRLIPYGYGFKMNLICGMLMLLVGLAGLCTDLQRTIYIASLFIVLGPLVFLQVLFYLLYSGIVAASPRRRVVEIVLCDVLSAGAILFGYLIVIGYTILNKEVMENPAEIIILASISMAMDVIYFAVAYKFFVIGSILYFVFTVFNYGVGIIFFELTEIEFSLVSASLISFLIVVLGVVSSSVLRRLLYKRPLSSLACGVGFRKAMQS